MKILDGWLGLILYVAALVMLANKSGLAGSVALICVVAFERLLCAVSSYVTAYLRIKK